MNCPSPLPHLTPIEIERTFVMISINRTQVDNLSKQLDSKQTLGKNDTALYPIFAHSLVNTNDTLKNFSTYEMAHWTNNADRWLSNRVATNTTGYARGTIIFADLGATNFKYEPSFTHPCVVLDQNRNFILVAPCSSKKYGKGYPEIVDATPADGFSCNTGIQTNGLRWISKNRVISTIGTTSTCILNCVDTLILNSVPLHKMQLIEKDKEIETLKNEKGALETEKEDLATTIKNLLAENEELRKKLTEVTP